MAGIRHGIIKKDDVHATGARSAEETLLGSALRIRKDQVKVEARPEDASSAWAAKSRLTRDLTGTIDRLFEVRTRHIEQVAPPNRKCEDTPEEEPELTPEEIEAQWKTRLEAAREAALIEGREAGLAEAKAQYDAELADIRQQFAEDLDGIQKSWEAFIRRSEPDFVQLAFQLTRAVLDAPIPDGVRQISERVVAEAVEHMAGEVAVEIILHPVSYLRIQEAGVEDQLNAMHSKLRWRSDADLKQNEWIVQSPRAATRRIEAELIDQLQRELSVTGRRDDEEPE